MTYMDDGQECQVPCTGFDHLCADSTFPVSVILVCIGRDDRAIAVHSFKQVAGQDDLGTVEIMYPDPANDVFVHQIIIHSGIPAMVPWPLYTVCLLYTSDAADE